MSTETTTHGLKHSSWAKFIPLRPLSFVLLLFVFSSILPFFCSQIVSVYCYSDVFSSIWTPRLLGIQIWLLHREHVSTKEIWTGIVKSRFTSDFELFTPDWVSRPEYGCLGSKGLKLDFFKAIDSNSKVLLWEIETGLSDCNRLLHSKVTV